MNTPHEPNDLDPRITAWLLGELPPDDAAEVAARVAADPELDTFCQDQRRAMELLEEALLSRVGLPEETTAFRIPQPTVETPSAPRKNPIIQWINTPHPFLARAAVVLLMTGVFWISLYSVMNSSVDSEMATPDMPQSNRENYEIREVYDNLEVADFTGVADLDGEDESTIRTLTSDYRAPASGPTPREELGAGSTYALPTDGTVARYGWTKESAAIEEAEPAARSSREFRFGAVKVNHDEGRERAHSLGWEDASFAAPGVAGSGAVRNNERFRRDGAETRWMASRHDTVGQDVKAAEGFAWRGFGGGGGQSTPERDPFSDGLVAPDANEPSDLGQRRAVVNKTAVAQARDAYYRLADTDDKRTPPDIVPGLVNGTATGSLSPHSMGFAGFASNRDPDQPTPPAKPAGEIDGGSKGRLLKEKSERGYARRGSEQTQPGFGYSGSTVSGGTTVERSLLGPTGGNAFKKDAAKDNSSRRGQQNSSENDKAPEPITSWDHNQPVDTITTLPLFGDPAPPTPRAPKIVSRTSSEDLSEFKGSVRAASGAYGVNISAIKTVAPGKKELIAGKRQATVPYFAEGQEGEEDRKRDPWDHSETPLQNKHNDHALAFKTHYTENEKPARLGERREQLYRITSLESGVDTPAPVTPLTPERIAQVSEPPKNNTKEIADATYTETIRVLQRELQGKLAHREAIVLAESGKYDDALKAANEAESLYANSREGDALGIEMDHLKANIRFAAEQEEDKKVEEIIEVAGEASVDIPVRPVHFNPFVNAATDPMSTFSIDVDTAAYTLARSYFEKDQLPPADTVRTEEFLNFFEYNYAAPVDEVFAVETEMVPTPFNDGWTLQVGVKGTQPARDRQRPLRLTVAVDTSGSMKSPARLALVKSSLRQLIQRLQSTDRIALVAYGEQASLLSGFTSGDQKESLLALVNALSPTGSTHLENGVRLAYEVAGQGFHPSAMNRVLLLSDGATNLGALASDPILERVSQHRTQGIFLSVFGFGNSDYNDALLEQLANKGDGEYRFIDSQREIERTFGKGFDAAMHPIAADVKIQVVFATDEVNSHRQIGYENRQLKHEDFRNDTVDAGEVGSGQTVTALYQLLLKNPNPSQVATVFIRYRNLETGAMEERSFPVRGNPLQRRFEDASTNFRLAACVAAFAEKLRGNPLATSIEYHEIATALHPVALERSLDPSIQEFVVSVRRAPGMPRATR